MGRGRNKDGGVGWLGWIWLKATFLQPAVTGCDFPLNASNINLVITRWRGSAKRKEHGLC